MINTSCWSTTVIEASLSTFTSSNTKCHHGKNILVMVKHLSKQNTVILQTYRLYRLIKHKTILMYSYSTDTYILFQSSWKFTIIFWYFLYDLFFSDTNMTFKTPGTWNKSKPPAAPSRPSGPMARWHFLEENMRKTTSNTQLTSDWKKHDEQAKRTGNWAVFWTERIGFAIWQLEVSFWLAKLTCLERIDPNKLQFWISWSQQKHCSTDTAASSFTTPLVNSYEISYFFCPFLIWLPKDPEKKQQTIQKLEPQSYFPTGFSSEKMGRLENVQVITWGDSNMGGERPNRCLENVKQISGPPLLRYESRPKGWETFQVGQEKISWEMVWFNRLICWEILIFFGLKMFEVIIWSYVFPQQQHFAMGSLAQIGGYGRFRCRYEVGFRMVLVQSLGPVGEVPEDGSIPLQIFDHLGLDPGILRLLGHQWKNHKRWVSFGGVVAQNPIIRPRGLPQGDPCAPVALALTLGAPLSKINGAVPGSTNFLYVDDRFILARTIPHLQQACLMWDELEQVARLRTATHKTQFGLETGRPTLTCFKLAFSPKRPWTFLVSLSASKEGALLKKKASDSLLSIAFPPGFKLRLSPWNSKPVWRLSDSCPNRLGGLINGRIPTKAEQGLSHWGSGRFAEGSGEEGSGAGSGEVTRQTNGQTAGDSAWVCFGRFRLVCMLLYVACFLGNDFNESLINKYLGVMICGSFSGLETIPPNFAWFFHVHSYFYPAGGLWHKYPL